MELLWKLMIVLFLLSKVSFCEISKGSNKYKGVSKLQFCTTERPQLFEFGVATCRTCRLRSKKAILEVATSNLQK